MSLEASQLKEREISTKYLSLQQSGECLSQLIRFSQRDLNHRVLDCETIDQRELILTMVHAVYLLYTAHCCACSFRLTKQVYVKILGREIATVYAVYILEEHYHTLSPQLQDFVNKNYEQYQYSPNNNAFQTQLLTMLSVFTNKMVSYSEKYPEFLAKAYKHPFEEFNFVVGQLIRPNLKLFTDPHTLMGCLQKTELFRDNSFLLNLKMSLLYDRIRPHIEEESLFVQLREMESNFRKALNQAIMKAARLKLISSFITAVLKLLINKNVLSIAASIDQQKNKKKAGKQGEERQRNGQGHMMKAHEVFTDRWQFYTKHDTLFLNPNNFIQYVTAADPQAFQRSNKTEIKNKANNYILEIDCDREIINLKILCPMGIGVDNIDSILYQIGTVSQHWYYPSFSLIDAAKTQDVLLTQKRLALSMGFRISPGRSTIGRLLLLVDVLLVNQRCFLAQLNKPPFKRDNPHRYNLSSEVAERMNLILLSNIQHVYQAQLSQQDTQNQ